MNTHPTFFLTLSISPTPSLSAISLFSSNHFLPSGLLFFLMQLPFIHLFLLLLPLSPSLSLIHSHFIPLLIIWLSVCITSPYGVLVSFTYSEVILSDSLLVL